MKRRSWLRTASFSALGGMTALVGGSGCRRGPKLDLQAHASDIEGVIKQHAEVCSSAYSAAWQSADALRSKISIFLPQPTAKAFADIRAAWTKAMLAYMETEGLRGFGTPADSFHKRIQAWPIDPKDLDTVPGSPKSGIVHLKERLPEITAEALTRFHEPSKGPRVIGLHALEFLIFGIDLYDDGGGYRAHTDYIERALGSQRRRALLEALANLLSADLKQMTDAWHAAEQGNFRAQFRAKAPAEALAIIFNGLTTSCATGLGGKLTRALTSGDQADEVCNFSDTSLEAIRHAIKGLQKVLSGEAPGRVIAGEERALLSLIAKADASLASEIESGFTSMAQQLAPLEQPFDQLIKSGSDAAAANAPARKVLESVAASLEKQVPLLKTAASALGAKVRSAA